jgi:hypothetical protein
MALSAGAFSEHAFDLVMTDGTCRTRTAQLLQDIRRDGFQDRSSRSRPEAEAGRVKEAIVAGVNDYLAAIRERSAGAEDDKLSP